MKKRHLRLFAVCALVVCLLTAAVLVSACNPDKKFREAYAKAEKSWDSAANKMVSDSATITANIGDGSVPWPVIIELEGKRVYIGDDWRFSYEMKLDVALGAGEAKIPLEGFLLDISKTGENVTLALKFGEILNESLSITEKEIRNYVPVFDFGANMFYDAEKISGDKENNFKISGSNSLAYLLYQIAPVVSLNFGFDLLPMLEKWLTLGDVAGKVNFNGDNFASITTEQNIKLSLPWEDAEFLSYNIDNFPIIVADFFRTKTLTLPLGPLNLDLDMTEVCPDALILDATIKTSGTHTILPGDASMDAYFTEE